MNFLGLTAPFYANPALVAAELANAPLLGLEVFALAPVVGEDTLDQYKAACGIKEGAPWKKDALAQARRRFAEGVRSAPGWNQFVESLEEQGTPLAGGLFATPPIDSKKLLRDAVSDKQQDARIQQLILAGYPGVFEALIEAAIADSGRFLPLMGNLVSPGFPRAEKGFAELFRHHPLSTFAYLQQNLPVKILLGKYFLSNVDPTTLIERIESDQKVIDCLIVLSILAAEGNTKAAEYAKNYDLDRLRETATPEREVRLLKHLAAAGNPKALERMKEFDVGRLDTNHEKYFHILKVLFWNGGNEAARKALSPYLHRDYLRRQWFDRAANALSGDDPVVLTRALNILIDLVAYNFPDAAHTILTQLEKWFDGAINQTAEWKKANARMEAIANADFSSWRYKKEDLKHGDRSERDLWRRMEKLMGKEGDTPVVPQPIRRPDDRFANAPSQLAGESSIAVAIGVPPEFPVLPQNLLWHPSPEDLFRWKDNAWHFYFPAGKNALTFGRGFMVDIRFTPVPNADKTGKKVVAEISRLHFKIRRLDGDNFIITVLGETNDVILNHSPEVLSPGEDHWISEGDIISIGKVEFVFHAKPKDIGR